MTKKMVSKFDNYYIEYGTKTGDLISIVMKLLEDYGPDAILDDSVDLNLRYEEEETDAEYKQRLANEERAKNRELNEYKRLKEKYGDLG